MAYDSATPTALALRAYERANLTAQARRARLNQGYGLTDSGDLDANNRAGSIYQGNLDSVNQAENAETADRARGFGGTGGLAGKHSTQADQAAQYRQSSMLTGAFGDIADTRQTEQDNKGQYEDSLTQIRANSDNAYAQSLIDNPVQVPQTAPQPQNATTANYPPALVAARMAALKKNPRAAQTAKQNRY